MEGVTPAKNDRDKGAISFVFLESAVRELANLPLHVFDRNVKHHNDADSGPTAMRFDRPPPTPRESYWRSRDKKYR